MLYIIATPIGNLADISLRAIQVLKEVNRIAAEDTRHSRQLLQHYNIKTPVFAFHEHNEQAQTEKLVQCLLAGEKIALISDAGTPLISDPGYRLLRVVHEHNIKVVPIPGPCALIAALCASGLATDRFVFEGFLPAKSGARIKHLQDLRAEGRTLIFYEAPHRLKSTLIAMGEVFSPARQAVLARELTKTFETIQHGSLQYLLDFVTADLNQQKGEMVIIVAGQTQNKSSVAIELSSTAEKIMQVLIAELPMKQAVKLAAEITGANKKSLYNYGLQLKAGNPE